MSKIRLLDAGARGGAWTGLRYITKGVELILCDADPEESKTLKKKVFYDKKWKSVKVISKAITHSKGKHTLYLTRQRGLSSLLEPDRKFIDYYYDTHEWDVIKQLNVDGVTLDQAFTDYQLEEISFVKLDTQGTELDILNSGQKKALTNLLGLYIEIEFLPFYRKQPLFSEINEYLEDIGFCLLDLKRTFLRRSLKDKPIYSKKELSWAHCLYLKNHDESLRLNYGQTLNLILICIGLEYFDRAVWLIDSSPHRSKIYNNIGNNIKSEIFKFSHSVWKEQVKNYKPKGSKSSLFGKKDYFNDTSSYFYSDRKVER